MTAIFKRELKSYLYSPIGYVFVGFFMFLSGWIFSWSNLGRGSGDLNYLFGNLTMVFMFLIPILTMRLISEEKNNKTDQLLLTSPVSITAIVTGKILSALCVFLVAILATLIYPAIVSYFTPPAWSEIFAIYFGFFLMGSAFISIGVFISSCTENQIISAVTTFVLLFVLYLLEQLVPTTPSAIINNILSWISITKRYTDFTMGIISLQSVIYYLSVVFLFGFLTIERLENRRYSK